MEKIGLSKFKDFEIDKKSLVSCLGMSGTSMTDECQTSGRGYSDTQTDIYSDDCEGEWNFECSYIQGVTLYGGREFNYTTC